eukprot:7381342-Prymnesium_polylepis.1
MGLRCARVAGQQGGGPAGVQCLVKRQCRAGESAVHTHRLACDLGRVEARPREDDVAVLTLELLLALEDHVRIRTLLGLADDPVEVGRWPPIADALDVGRQERPLVTKTCGVLKSGLLVGNNLPRERARAARA